MWTLISGQIISYIFEYLIIKLYKNNFSNKNMSIAEISLGWLFQEHVREDFNMTGGKRFMLKKDFRNRFITNSIKITRNIIFWSHAITTFELGTFLILLSLFFYLIIIQIINVNKQKANYILIELFILLIILIILHQQLKLYVTFFVLVSLLTYLIWTKIVILKKMEYILTELFVVISLTLIITQGLKIYWVFDVFFITRPLMLLLIGIFILLCPFWGSFLIYLFITVYSKKLSLLIKVYSIKILFFSFYIYLTCKLLLKILNFENLNSENFFQELTIKFLLVNCYLFEN